MPSAAGVGAGEEDTVPEPEEPAADDAAGEAARRRNRKIKIYYDEYQRIGHTLASYLALQEEAGEEVKEEDLIAYHIETVKDQIQTEAQRLDQQRLVQLIISRLIEKDRVIVVSKLSEDPQKPEERVLVKHPNFPAIAGRDVREAKNNVLDLESIISELTRQRECNPAQVHQSVMPSRKPSRKRPRATFEEGYNPLDRVYYIISDLARHEAVHGNDGWVDLAHIVSMAGHSAAGYRALTKDMVQEAIECWESLSIIYWNPEKTMVRFTFPP